MRPQGGSQETPGHVQPHSLLRESVTSGDLHRLEPCFTGRSLSLGVELLEVLDVPGVLDGDPVLCLQARGTRPGDTGNPKQALPHERERERACAALPRRALIRLQRIYNL